ncbi:MAG: signal peptidase-like protein subunit [Linnemannia elongata]|nr:MAG: signal peptidase-like protein subunit [Linnemannia elongata]
MFEFHIDFQGQSLAEQITQGVISFFGVMAFFIGLIAQDIRLSMYIFAAGVVVAAFLVIPAWPYLRKNPIKWLPSREKLAAAAAAGSNQESSASDLKDKKAA